MVGGEIMTPTLTLPLSGRGNEAPESSSLCKGEVGAQRRVGVNFTKPKGDRAA